MNNTVYIYVFDTMSDWETGYLAAEMNSGRFFKKGVNPYKVVTAGAGKAPIKTMGGMTILPDIDVKDCMIKSGDILVLPGGNTWDKNIHETVLEKAEYCLKNKISVAAICGATIALAYRGLLDSVSHTSNGPGFLKMVCPQYAGEEFYKDEPAVTDNELITAAGTAPIEFAMQIFKKLEVFSDKTLSAWYNFYKTGKSEYFFEIMESIR